MKPIGYCKCKMDHDRQLDKEKTMEIIKYHLADGCSHNE